MHSLMIIERLTERDIERAFVTFEFPLAQLVGN
jgi:hypothetical protein